MQTRDRGHQLIDELPDDALLAIERRLYQRQAGAGLRSPAISDPPGNDEPLSCDDATALKEELVNIAAGRAVLREEARRRVFGAP